MIIRIWHGYTLWEEWQAGLYLPEVATEQDVMDAAFVLSDPEMCRLCMVEAVRAWPVSAEHHLSDTRANRRAWLGRSAMFIGSGARETTGRAAWLTLSRAQMDAANAIANEIIRHWETTRGTHGQKRVGAGRTERGERSHCAYLR